MVTELEIRKQVRRLRNVFSTGKNEDEQVKAWSFVFDGEGIDNQALMAAVSKAAKSESRYMPNPGQVLAIAKEARGGIARVMPTKSRDETQPCPVCGAVLRLLPPEDQVHFGWDDVEGEYRNLGVPVPADSPPRYGVLHDLQKHRAAGVQAVGYWR